MNQFSIRLSQSPRPSTGLCLPISKSVRQSVLLLVSYLVGQLVHSLVSKSADGWIAGLLEIDTSYPFVTDRMHTTKVGDS